MIKPNTVMSKSIALLLLVLTILSIISAFDVFFYQSYTKNSQEITNLNTLISKYESRQINIKQARRHLEKIQKATAENHFYLIEKKKSVAIANLQNKLKNLLLQKKGILLSSQLIQSAQKDDSERLTIRVKTRLSPASLRSILYTLETQRPFLHIDNLIIQPVKTSNSPETSSKQELDVEMDVSGYRKG
ncbi:MAG: type II secretion system protein GspM [Sneathiella sp.]